MSDVKRNVLSREEMLKKQELAVEWVPFNLEGDGVYVKEMTSSEKDAFEGDCMEEHETPDGTEYKPGFNHFRAKLAVRTVVDEKGEHCFCAEDATELSESMGAKRMEMITRVAQTLNKISKKDREALEKKSKGSQVSGSNSDSAKP